MSTAVELTVNEKIVERFRSLMGRERLAHAYLLIGPEGSGKVETAFAVAKLVNCEALAKSFCGKCSSCLKIDGGNHPDVLMFDQGEDQSIKIHKIRELIQRVQLRPYEAKKKVVILKDMDLLTTEGANALLKTLEEPAASSLLLLTTANPERVMETVKSRCHAVHFFGLSRHELSGRLQKEAKMPAQEADVMSGFSEGCYGKACRLQEEDFIRRKNELINKFLFDSADEALLKFVLSDREMTKETLDILLFCFKDLVFEV